MEPYESGGSGTREEETPVCQLDLTEGGGSGQIRCRENTGPREEGAVRRLSDSFYMLFTELYSNEGADMSAMHLVQGRTVNMTQTKTYWMGGFCDGLKTIRPC